MTRFCRLDGKPAAEDDVMRGVWYSSRCKYWTDDWSKLKKVGPGIPVCPECQSVGFQTVYQNFQGKDKPKETCNDNWFTKDPAVPSVSHWLPPESKS